MLVIAKNKIKILVIAGWEKTKEVNEKHQITSKIGNIFKAGWMKTKEVNEKYEISTKVGTGLVTGLTVVSDAAVGVVEKVNRR